MYGRIGRIHFVGVGGTGMCGIAGYAGPGSLEPDAVRRTLDLMEHRERSKALLATLRDLGVKVALDDFGVGYSSLSYLHRLPVDAVKVDRSFVGGLPRDPGSTRIVEAVVGMSRAFGIGAVAEGVETEDQLAAIRAAGCSGAQGYGLARPVPAGELTAAIAEAVRRARA